MATPERTSDGRYVVIGGRRWRASDPSLDTPVRKALVDQLMAVRRAVGDAEDDEAERLARAEVHDAKVALGERGQPWWEEPEPEALAERRAAAVRALARAWDLPEDADRVQQGADHVVSNLPADGRATGEAED